LPIIWSGIELLPPEDDHDQDEELGMRRICAWCSKDLGEIVSALDAQDVISHGLCQDCEYHLFAQMGMPLEEYLDGLRAPIVVVDPTGALQTANKQARTLLQKELPDIEGLQAGDVFECAYAIQPEGCGNTIHCSGCTIRMTVMETFRTGQSCLKVPAYLNRQMSDGVERVHFLISTEKVADLVLLRIDAVEGQEP
jgi:hypothetical protein